MRDSQYPFNDYEQGPNFDRARSQIATPFQYVDIPLDVAGLNVIFNISGDFLYCDPDPGGSIAAGGMSKAGIAVVELNNQQSAPVAPFFVQPGFAIEALFKQIKLSWPAQAGKVLRLLYSTGERIVPTNTGNITGTVNVLDSGLTRTAMNQGQLAGCNQAAVAAQYSQVQLWNPAASGKTLYLESFFLSSPVANIVILCSMSVALAAPIAGLNKNILAGPGVGQLRRGANGAPVGVAVACGQVSLAAGVPLSFAFKEPVAIPQNAGFGFYLMVVNTDLYANFEWYEQ